MPINAGIIFSRIFSHYEAPPQDVALGEALDAFVTLLRDKMADAWFRFYRWVGASAPKNTRADPAEEIKYHPTLMK